MMSRHNGPAQTAQTPVYLSPASACAPTRSGRTTIGCSRVIGALPVLIRFNNKTCSLYCMYDTVRVKEHGPRRPPFAVESVANATRIIYRRYAHASVDVRKTCMHLFARVRLGVCVCVCVQRTSEN